MRKKSKYPPTNEGINKKLYIYTIECYSVMKTNEKMPFAATWM